MTGTPTGFLGKQIAERPALLISVFSIGAIALCVVGARSGADFFVSDAIAGFAINSLVAVALPISIFAWRPNRTTAQIFYFLVAMGVLGAIAAAPRAAPGLSLPLWPSPAMMSIAAFLLGYLILLAPFFSSHLRLSFAAAFSVILAACGAIGYFAISESFTSPLLAPVIAFSVCAGATIGFGVAFDYAENFAKGATRLNSVGAAAHSALAPTAFAIMAGAAIFATVIFRTGLGVIDWSLLWPSFSAILFVLFFAVIGVGGSLALTSTTEQVAVDENYLRRWFSLAWRPLRFALPPSSALAASAIAAIIAVIAFVDASIAAPILMLVAISFIAVAALVAFVSIRTSLLLVAVLAVSGLLARYVYALWNIPVPAVEFQLLVLAVIAVAIVQIAGGWRDANAKMRNARDIAEAAMASGFRKFLAGVGTSAAFMGVIDLTLANAPTYSVISFFVVNAAICLLLLPPMMAALSAQTKI